MNAKRRNALIERIKDCLKSHGYTEDAHGNFKNTAGNIRFKFEKIVLRKESKTVIHADKYSAKQTIWQRIASGYYSEIFITADNKISGLKR